MARKFFARTAVAQAAIIAVTTALATTNCSPDAGHSEPPVVCRREGNTLARSSRYGQTLIAVKAETAADGGLVEVAQVTRSSKFVMSYAKNISSSGLTIAVTFGEEIDGIRSYVIRSTDGKRFTGEVDGREIAPFEAAGASAMRFADGGAIPNAVPRDGAVREELAKAAEALDRDETCTSQGLGKATQAVVRAGTQTDRCQNCRDACQVVLGGVAVTSLACLSLAWCPPCAAACVAVFFAVAVVGYFNCRGLCDIAYCVGEPCGTVAGDMYRCQTGEQCADPLQKDLRRNACCPIGTEACGMKNWTESGRTFRAGQCCETSKGETCAKRDEACCVAPRRAVDGQCCDPGRIFRRPDGSSGCCKSALCSNGSCCDGLGSCMLGGGCCSSPCNGACCDAGAGEACLLGTGGQKCCKGAQKCGTKCCGDGTVCLDALLETCGVAPCPAGEVATRDEATGGTICCPPGAFGGCNGACCGSLEFCCGSPQRCSLSCIK